MKYRRGLILIIFLFIFVLTGCKSFQLFALPEDFGLLTIDSKEKLQSLLNESNNRPFYYNWFNRGEMVDGPTLATEDAQTKTSDYTTTNVQVEGIDEGDIVKTDGKRIYSIENEYFRVVEVGENGGLSLVLNEKIQSASEDMAYYHNQYNELYLTDDYVITIGYHYYYRYYIYDGTIEQYNGYTSAIQIVIYDIDSLEQVKIYELSGYVLASRLIEDNLYIIGVDYPLMVEDEIGLPYFVEDGEIEIAELTDIKYLPDSNYNAFTVITRIELEEEISLEHDIFLAASGWGQIYVSHNGIYFAGTNYFYSLLEYRQEGILISYQFDQTGKVVYGGKGTYEGWVIDQFAMDEYDGYMRIATTTGWGETAKNRLYVFQRQRNETEYILKVVGKIDENLGKPGETIQSVRFNEDIATVVTFERTDPLYTIDLSDPTNPFIIGALDVLGYSVYQHFWTDNLVIGIGFDADEQGVTLGMKLSLFDISIPETPVEVGNPLLLTKDDHSWSYSEALYNHKAIMIDKSHQLIGFALWRYNWSNGFYHSMNDYIVFSVDEEAEQPIEIKHVISHIDYFNEYNIYRTYWSRYDFSIDRALRIDDYLFVVSGVAVTSHNLIGEFGLIDEVVFANTTIDN